MSKGQASLFISIAVVILLAGGFLAYTYFAKKDETPYALSKAMTSDQLRSTIEDYVQNCIELVAQPLISSLSMHGGSFEPNSGISYRDQELTVYCTDQENGGCINNLVLRQDMEEELSLRVGQALPSCVNWEIFKEQGAAITSDKFSIQTQIQREAVVVTLGYPITVQTADLKVDISQFTKSIAHPLGRMHGAAIDIINDEISLGFFDKEKWMIDHGFEMVVEKHKPYPNIIYILTKIDRHRNINYTFQFAIKGVDTVATSNKRTQEQTYGCCVNDDGACYKNAPAAQCFAQYVQNTGCTCKQFTEPIYTGCCRTKNGCEASTEQACAGDFLGGDIGCFSCPQNHCQSTWIAETQSFSGPKRAQGESWCGYDAIVGYGFDYVGSRHYIHSCVNGQEILEECRDFREEICVEGGNGARCRLNRWQDCSSQQDSSSCQDRSIRDCYWLSPLLLNRNTHCVPYVPPGFKFWEGNGLQICNYASENPTSYQRMARPRTWGHSTLLFCQRMGDCGNYRNLFGEITKFGYFNQLGDPEEWVYNEEGHEKKAHTFILELPADIQAISSQKVAMGSQGSYATCNLWEAPNRNDLCEACSEPFKVCSEYRCKSIGRQCRFSMVNDVGRCTSAGAADTEKPQITFDESSLTFGFSIKKVDNTYFGGVEYQITPQINPYQPITIGLITSKPSRCKISLRPPNVPKQLWFSNLLLAGLPQGYLSNDYRTHHNFTARFPDKSLGNFTQYYLFFSCQDNYGNVNEDEVFLNIKLKDPAVAVAPKVLAMEPDASQLKLSDQKVPFQFFVNKPFKDCRISSLDVPYEGMQDSLNCSATVYEIMFFPGIPMGSFQCSSSYVFDKHRFYANCMDWFNKAGTESFEIDVP